ncbi:hypothetical protein ASS64_14395 [Erythrobacter sp. AP23]|nr:hypothetical protein ASS64_14395 [Erythrobacter sp. AP23]
MTVLDRDDGPARSTSFANGAQLSYAYSDALGSPALLRSLPWLVLGTDPSFRIAKPLSPRFWAWGMDFLRNCSRKRFSANTIAALGLAAESRLAMHALLERHPLEFSYKAAGKMHLYYGEASFPTALKVMDLKRSHGVHQEALTPVEAERIEPALGSVGDLAGVIYSPEDEVGDPHRFAVGLLDLLRSEYGIRSRFGFDVVRLSLIKGGVELVSNHLGSVRARHVVVCAGVGASTLIRSARLRAPICPMKGYSFTAPPGVAAPHVSITDTERKLVFCRLGDQMRVAGLAELGAWDTAVDPERLRSLVELAQSSLPDAADYRNAGFGWAGLRPMAPSSVPCITRARPEIILNIGHGMLGWTFAMGSGERAAALLQ